MILLNYPKLVWLIRIFHHPILIKQTNKELPGEFLGRLVLGVEDNIIKVYGATIY